ncbi:MAG: Spx/MgsR family RNA polymerase-binding regulatory protein [Wenzhouxiangella sp.]
MSVLVVYGIKSCDTCRKALKWLDEQGRDYRWHDVRADGLERATLESWLAAIGAERLVNRRSTTWRGLDENTQLAAMDSARAVDVLLAHPTLLKRPVIAVDDCVTVGFNAAVKDSL